MLEELKKRELNKSTKKYKLMMTVLESLKTNQITEINIGNICEECNISKVTFFKYFSTKEEILEYFIHYWEYNAGYEIHRQNLTGVEAIQFLFTEAYEKEYSLNVFKALINHMSKKVKTDSIEITSSDLFTFNRNAFEEGYRNMSLYQLINSNISDGSPEKTVILISVFYTYNVLPQSIRDNISVSSLIQRTFKA